MALTNRLFISGTLTKDASVNSGQKDGMGTWTNCKLNLLVETEIKVKGGTGTAMEKMFIDCTVWGNDVSKYQHLKSGSKLDIEGRLKMEAWTDQSGSKKYKPVIVPEKITLPKEIINTIEDMIKITNRKPDNIPTPKFGNKVWQSGVDDNDELPF